MFCATVALMLGCGTTNDTPPGVCRAHPAARQRVTVPTTTPLPRQPWSGLIRQKPVPQGLHLSGWAGQRGPTPGAARPRPLPRSSPSSSSCSCSRFLPGACRTGPGLSHASHPAILRYGLKMQLAEEEKVLPGRLPSPSQEMSGDGRPRGTSPALGHSAEDALLCVIAGETRTREGNVPSGC